MIRHDIIKGVIGTTLPITASVTLTQVEVGLRLASLCVGIAVGAISFYSIYKKLPKQ